MMAESNAGEIELGLKMQTMKVEQPEEKSKKDVTIPIQALKNIYLQKNKFGNTSTIHNLHHWWAPFAIDKQITVSSCS